MEEKEVEVVVVEEKVEEEVEEEEDKAIYNSYCMIQDRLVSYVLL